MAEGVKVDPKATPGLVQVDLTALPNLLKAATPGKAFGWRHSGRPGAVTAAVEALVARVSATVGNRVALRPEGIDVRVVAQVLVERAGIFGVELDVPGALEVTDVVARARRWTTGRACPARGRGRPWWPSSTGCSARRRSRVTGACPPRARRGRQELTIDVPSRACAAHSTCAGTWPCTPTRPSIDGRPRAWA
jgi:hypothetical protein